VKRLFKRKVVYLSMCWKKKIRVHPRLRDSEPVSSASHKNHDIIFFNTKKVITHNFSLKKLSNSSVFSEIAG